MNETCVRKMQLGNVAKKNGVSVLELDHKGEPYKLWMVDLNECPVRGAQCAARFAFKPL